MPNAEQVDIVHKIKDWGSYTRKFIEVSWFAGMPGFSPSLAQLASTPFVANPFALPVPQSA
jgi:hypothetical protein